VKYGIVKSGRKMLKLSNTDRGGEREFIWPTTGCQTVRKTQAIIACHLYPVSQKAGHPTLAHNFAKVNRFSIFFSPSDSEVNV